MDKKNKKFKYYTDGIKTIKIYEDDEIPDGFYLGRTFKSNPWNKGLTKETSERVAANGKSTSKGMLEKLLIPWNKGLTKENSESLLRVSEKVSIYRKDKPSWNKGLHLSEETKKKMSEAKKGKPSWCRGLTKETNESLKKISLARLEHNYYIDWSAAKLKEYETKKRNNSFNTSKPEEEYYQYLLTIYDEDDIIRLYRSELYPFNCDFYIKSENLYIELNYSWTHGDHPFDKDNQEDLQLLESWKQRAVSSNYYKAAVHVWSLSDPLKLETVRKNNLNFEFIYPNNLIITK